MSIDLNHPLGEKNSARQSFYKNVILRLIFFLCFFIFITGISIYIIFSEALIGTTSNEGKNYFLREVKEVVIASPLRDKSISETPKRVVETKKIEADSALKGTIANNDINGSVNLTSTDSSPTIKERLLSVISKDELSKSKGHNPWSFKIGDSANYLENYKKYCPDTDHNVPRIALVVSGLGISQTGTQRAINLLPANSTLAFASNGNSLNRWIQEATKKGQETILQIPMQDFTESDGEDDSYVLKVKQSDKALLSRLRHSLGRATKYSGVMNYRGAMFLSNKYSTKSMFQELSKRKLFFLDDGNSVHNLTKELAPMVNLPYAVADLYLGYQVNRDKISKKLKDLEYIARVSGQAIGVVVAFDENVDGIIQWLQKDYMKDIIIVPLSCLVKFSNQSSQINNISE
ncbi:MAG: divergent polysaccharide deacetylase family protein [Candidatus Liberibacter europaeus]|uniref:Divergent polysaccharide deacetylase family protein n=1 Tax=Candidatus Liberibacter europaeus TaxID=744859 RepID=A0A2T4VYH8_9HYPH|nr:divergent polysaccharide deacetylase family protein [Candidatus Liberibacter europaeus]PTL86816.1 MAG: divergent polysaccharide deacetylase family protein [Candidatus Liberibacter europaeus]